MTGSRTAAAFSAAFLAAASSVFPAAAGAEDAEAGAVAPLLRLPWDARERDVDARFELRKSAFGGFQFDASGVLPGARKALVWFDGPDGALSEILVEGRPAPGEPAWRATASLAAALAEHCGAATSAGRFYLWRNERCFARIETTGDRKWIIQMAPPDP